MLEAPLLAVAYGADLLLGDPRWFPHPVRGMGMMIEWGERWLRRLIPWERLGGLLLVVMLVGGLYAGTWWLLDALHAHAAGWGFVVSAILLFSCLSTRDLALESDHVLRALKAHDLPLARRRVARIVGRDTQGLDEPEIVRATLETIAESTMDGILSPLFYVAVGGVPLAIAYKTINTLDSMIGHRSARYLKFGSAAARVDTWANWMPARWSVVVFTLAALVRGGRARQTWRSAWRHGHMGTVPNAGLPEAALAGALGVRLGGINWYDGVAVTMPRMGKPTRPLTPERIRDAIRLMYTASVIAWLTALLVVWLRAPGCRAG